MTTEQLHEVAGLAAGLLGMPVAVDDGGEDTVRFRAGQYIAAVDRAWLDEAVRSGPRLSAVADFVARQVNAEAAEQHQREHRARGAESGDTKC